MPLCPWTAQIDPNGVKARVCLLCYAMGIEEGVIIENGNCSVASSDTDSVICLPPETLDDLSQKPATPVSPDGHPFPYNPDLLQNDAYSPLVATPFRNKNASGCEYSEATHGSRSSGGTYSEQSPNTIDGSICRFNTSEGSGSFGEELRGQVVGNGGSDSFLEESRGPAVNMDRSDNSTDTERVVEVVSATENNANRWDALEEQEPSSLEEAIFLKRPSLVYPKLDELETEKDKANGDVRESLEEAIFLKKPTFKLSGPSLRATSMREVPILRLPSKKKRGGPSGVPGYEGQVPRVGPAAHESSTARSDEEVVDLLAVRLPWSGGAVAAADSKSAVLQWQADSVCRWIEATVPFPPSRGLEYGHSFRLAGVDGLTLLTMQRSHHACKNMTDADWQTFKTARRRLLTGRGAHGYGSAPATTRMAASDSAWHTTEQPTAFFSRSVSTLSGAASLKKLSQTRSRSNVWPACSSSPARSESGSSSVSWLWNLVGWRKEKGLEEQLGEVTEEVQELRGELTCAEEREATLQAVLEHLDDVLKSSQLAEYIYTRTRCLLRDPFFYTNEEKDNDDDDEEEDDDDGGEWLQRFVVLHEDTISYYMLATDIHPQGTIPIAQVVEAAVIPPEDVQIAEEGWFAFQITTCDQLRLECATKNACKVETWLGTIAEKRRQLQQVDPLLGKIEPWGSRNGLFQLKMSPA
ncbi:hypothetical protein CBR_g4807 [Chara braunii]|uniref:PH domain-containing protein n=1 Tax=Chara braunii TaxID=69332 RepID=A0A388KIW9_CHABU|nr:hypothetical protein CBR_g4807 [Chara braunii]|eukprot:GBG69979.1 hypothetical protein CBR_g4807 [Chara braunii]